MRLLVLGGTQFLSHVVAAQAVSRGHEVTCACRGSSGPLPEGVDHVVLDRSDPDWGSDLVVEQAEQLEQAEQPDLVVEQAEERGRSVETTYDAVVDVARHPTWVRDAVTRFPDAHWVFVSTVNVYSDNATPGGTPESLPLHDPVTTDEDLAESPEAYGPMKVACEQLVRAGAPSSTVIRPGLIVGPGDPSGRFSYWPSRVAGGGQVLAPGSPEDHVQLVDVRDLADWIVTCAEQRTPGTFGGAGRAMTRREFLDEVARGVGTEPDWVWADQAFLADHDVAPWAGPRSLPLWLPLPEYAGLMSHDVEASYAAGLATRPIADTARDTLAWLRANPDAEVTGMTRDEEAELLNVRHL